MIIPVILGGGSGKRLWPVSRTNLPKQLINLYNEKSLLQNTLVNIEKIPHCHAPIVIINQEYCDLINEQLDQIGLDGAQIICEPQGRNTAPAITIAALSALENDPDAQLLVLPIDHCFDDIEPFTKAVEKGLSIIEQGYLLTFGISVEHPSTDFGYINAGQAIGDAYTINAFLEKPSIALAKQFYQSGDYYWNAGIFLFRADSLLQQIETLCPEIYHHCTHAWKYAKKDQLKCYLDAKAFLSCPDISIDYAVMEKTTRGAVIPTKAQWFDIGNWKSLYDFSKKDQQQNVINGDVIVKQCHGNYIRSENRLVAIIGLENCVIIETKDAVLVADMDHLSELSNMVQSLQEVDTTK